MNKIRIAAAALAVAFCLSGCSAIADTLSPRGPEGPRDPEQYDSKEEKSKPSEKPGSAPDKPDGDRTSSDGEESFSQVTDSKQGVEDLLVSGAWVETGDGSALGMNDSDRSDTDEWYYGSDMWFERSGSVTLTSGGNTVGGTYEIEDDFTVTVTFEAGSVFDEEKKLSYSLGSSRQYGLLLYTNIGKRNIKYYSARI